ncbi:MAG: hypothetical protein WCI05_01220 [Myxococcales bacterium]
MQIRRHPALVQTVPLVQEWFPVHDAGVGEATSTQPLPSQK